MSSLKVDGLAPVNRDRSTAPFVTLGDGPLVRRARRQPAPIRTDLHRNEPHSIIRRSSARRQGWVLHLNSNVSQQACQHLAQNPDPRSRRWARTPH
jgi:hypothetical protein